MPRRSIPFGETPTLFEQFWAAWSRRRGKGDALKAWLTINPSPELASKIVTAAKEQDSWPEYTREDRQFQPYPATWLRRWGWEDQGRPATFLAARPEPVRTPEQQAWIETARAAQRAKLNRP